MTPTIKTLTAVAALTLAAGGALAQDNRQTVPLAQPDAAAVAAPETGTTYVVNPDGSRQVLTAEEPATDEAAEDAETDAAEATDAAPEADTADEATEAEPAEAAAEDGATEAEATEAEATDTDEATADEEEATDTATEDEATEATEADDTAEEADATEDNSAEDDATEEEAPEVDATEEEVDTEAADDEVATAEEPAPVPEQHISDVAFSFEGPFGRYDQHQLQRGLQVYTEVCAACHGLQYVPLRTLGDATGPGLPADQVRAYAEQYYKEDPDTGDEVPREPSDNFPHIPFQDGMGPDLSLMAKARAGFHGPYGTGINQLFNGIGGPEYIYSILTGYTGETKEEAGTTLYENTAFPGGWISMPEPIFDEMVDFEDGHPNDLASISKEVSAFLMWTAEPKMMQRKQVGTVAVLFLLLLSVLLYLTNKRLWTHIKHPRKNG